MSNDESIPVQSIKSVLDYSKNRKKNYDKIALILAAISNVLFFFPAFAIQFIYMFHIILFFTAVGLLLAVFSFIWSIILAFKTKSVLAILAVLLSFIPIGLMVVGVVLLAFLGRFLQSWNLPG